MISISRIGTIHRRRAVGLALVALLASCGGDDSAAGSGGSAAAGPDTGAFASRLDALDEAVGEWAAAETIEDAHVAAETSANLVVGPDGPGYGDRNGDGAIDGENVNGLLPGSDGTPDGLATGLDSVGCVERDVLGGAWDDPADRWGAMLTAIDEWRPDRNTMPSLPSHPMRAVGWATFTLATDSLDDAQEFAGHARLHVDVSRRALDC